MFLNFNAMHLRYPSSIIKRAFGNAACSTHPSAHKNFMKQIENTYKLATETLKKIDAKSWSKAFISTFPKADNIENNMSECFDSWIINERYI